MNTYRRAGNGRFYHPQVKLMVVQWLLQGATVQDVFLRSGLRISRASCERWLFKYQATGSVISPPEDYKTLGGPTHIEPHEREMLKDAIEDDPTLFQREMVWNLEEDSGVRVSQPTISRELSKKIHLTHKVCRTRNPNQSEMDRAAYTQMVSGIPLDRLVFLGQSFSLLVFPNCLLI
ncbi:uncharacterized protein MELLADRAFT_63565 [Melampsora larici-populina 98AG31]|uniref:Transposase Tc1-like domain-containing protein n=1 Tax=Melampsora larici-populina (strain 98AG31 / pathotype 3-4-7) TaxID=747676 RepID=F4RN41_MELLP|nr:uncharacterized protein MELLADRAFT_63565 [Melampsora larici-populina 98AG31]EGG06284.1 hypothetical protein MELLADRAFT_63565 [Melampsora larici-populina 98AG31]